MFCFNLIDRFCSSAPAGNNALHTLCFIQTYPSLRLSCIYLKLFYDFMLYGLLYYQKKVCSATATTVRCSTPSRPWPGNLAFHILTINVGVTIIYIFDVTAHAYGSTNGPAYGCSYGSTNGCSDGPTDGPGTI